MFLSRRRVLFGGLTLVTAGGVISCADESALASPALTFEEQVRELEARYNAFIGLYAVNLESGATVASRADEAFALCSTFKTYAAAAVLQRVAAGELSLEQRLFVDPAALLPNSPVTGENAGHEMTLAELSQAALQRSDNLAANLLLETLGGPSAITAFARSIGDDRTRLDRWEIELNSAIPGDPRDTSTPRALATGYRNLLAGEALPAAQRELLDGWMRANQTSSMRAGLPPGWTTADKTGSGDYGTTNDSGVAYGPDGTRLLLTIMTRTQSADPEAEGLRPLIGELAALALPHLVGPR
ncbi:class A beta-lactamase [Mycolicibacterium diernhoferi]|uniref:Beta-lactamase n=1 Tax=Mycolicibacterium diernhoferi TaxID=1801 RepID=A0A1Q4HAL3_9MYCO|nr:class A beta-lactamase [Mycolicibacterium diernhoferi]OJZ64574.1 class A beta-lactamase [Mycolicibacterium diernhoferi]OPE48784.1 class A beta-lactamase [Mycolicibacterium diernhoferi]PEG51813.1 class A beta-lactamase [Mycolicibacterium diernhoferi]QYL24900.1 class A beta-lactamase [Mycolicibacterium diernhoferi]